MPTRAPRNKPEYYRVDEDHSLAGNLLAGWIFSRGDWDEQARTVKDVRGRYPLVLSANANLVRADDQHGMCLAPNSGDGAVLTPIPASWSSLTDYTVLVGFRVDSDVIVGGGNDALVTIADASGPQDAVQLSWTQSGETLQAIFEDDDTSNVSSSTALDNIAGSWVTGGARCEGGVNTWVTKIVDGNAYVEVASGVTTIAGTPANQDALSIGQYDGGGNAFELGIIEYCYLFDTNLTQAQIESLHENPYQFLLAQGAPVREFRPVIPIRQHVKPDYPQIDWGSRLSRGLLACYVMTPDGYWLEILSGARSTKNASEFATVKIGFEQGIGWYAESDGTVITWSVPNANVPQLKWNNRVTVGSLIKTPAASEGGPASISQNSGGGDDWLLTYNWSRNARQVGGSLGVVGSNPGIPSANTETGIRNAWNFVALERIINIGQRGGTGNRGWAASYDTTSTLAPYSADPNHNMDLLKALPGKQAMLLTWGDDGVITSSDLRSLEINPNQIFQGNRPKYFPLPTIAERGGAAIVPKRKSKFQPPYDGFDNVAGSFIADSSPNWARMWRQDKWPSAGVTQSWIDADGNGNLTNRPEYNNKDGMMYIGPRSGLILESWVVLGQHSKSSSSNNMIVGLFNNDTDSNSYAVTAEFTNGISSAWRMFRNHTYVAGLTNLTNADDYDTSIAPVIVGIKFDPATNNVTVTVKQKGRGDVSDTWNDATPINIEGNPAIFWNGDGANPTHRYYISFWSANELYTWQNFERQRLPKEYLPVHDPNASGVLPWRH